MKHYLPFAIIAITVLSLGSLTSCHEEDFDVSTTVLQERAFEQNFIKEFGKPSSNQSWDFYAQKMDAIRQEAGMTRATMADEDPIVEVIKDNSLYPSGNDYFDGIVNTVAFALEEGIDNSRTGQNYYTLTSTGDFKIYAVRYAGAIETGQTYSLDFGVAYYDENGDRVLTNIFGRTTGGTGNPKFAAEVKIPKGQKFHFYLRYTYTFDRLRWNGQGSWIARHNQEEIFYSDESPTFIQANGQPLTYSDYDGPSTLLYSTSYVDPETGKDEQVMMIGFEDAWGHGTGNGTQNGWFDKDFNDIVFIIDGELPVPSSKRFFCEDKTSYDWDYNDVVFDVSNTGIVLRAVGGTLPVFLRVTDRLGQTETYGELHELMRSIQPQESHRTKELTYQRMEDGKMKTFYKPIDVAAFEINNKYPGIWFDAVQICTWTKLGTDEGDNFTRLDDDKNEVERFGTDPSFKGKAELIVLPEYKENYDLNEISNYTALTTLSSDANDKVPYKIITATPPGNIPSMWIAPVSVSWMKEMQKITLGYRYFYGGSGETETDAEGHTIPIQWYEKMGLNPNFWYQFDRDEK